MAEEDFYRALYLLQSDNPNDHNSAFSILLECEKRGSNDAAYTIGDLYLKGQGVEKNVQKGIEKLNFLADRGNIPSLHALATYKYRGIHLERDLEGSFELFNSLSELGDESANFELAVMYELGQGTSQNLQQALEYYKKVPKHIKSATFYYAKLLISMGGSTDKSMMEEGLQILRQLAEQNYAPASFEIGNIYYLGKIVPQDFSQALKYFTIAAKHGIILAHFYAGICYEFGLSVNKNIDKAILYYISPSSLGCVDAQNRLKDLNKDAKFPEYIEVCTHSFTKLKSIRQHMFECRTCGLYSNCAICVACARKCHAGHDIVDLGITSDFYCSCCDDRKGCLLCK